MVAKPHRQNSEFQLRHFLAGSCSTADGAYILMYGQRIDMESKLAHAESQLKRRQAKLKACQAKETKARRSLADIENRVVINEGDNDAERLQAEADILDAEAERLEIEADIPTWTENWEAAKLELSDINKLMDEIRPHCLYADLSIHEQSAKAQQAEWLGELKQRAENFILSQGFIPHDHLQTMRMHPQFKQEIVPLIKHLDQQLMRIGTTANYGAGTQAGPQHRIDIALDLQPAQLGFNEGE